METGNPPIAPLSKALSEEAAAQKILDAKREERAEAEALHRAWEARTEALNRLVRSRQFASEQPLHFVRDSQSPPFTGQEIRVLQNFIQIKAKHAALTAELIFSLSHTMQDGSSLALFSELAHVQAVVTALESSEVFAALRTRAEAFARQRASELGKTLEAEFATHRTWCRDHGANPPAPVPNQ